MAETELVDYDALIHKLHEFCGICGHCGKKKCLGRQSHSQLPDKLSMELVLRAIEESKLTGET